MAHAANLASLEVFARTGRLGPLELGCPRNQVLDLLGDPTHISRGLVPECSDVWMYGDAGLYFDEERLYLMQFENFEVPIGGSALKLEPWILRRGLRLEALQRALRAASIEFRTEPDPMSPICSRVVTVAGAYFILQTEGDADELGLCVFGRRAART